ncbi:unnamed protein product, partial [Rotaria sp. Silwood2]
DEDFNYLYNSSTFQYLLEKLSLIKITLNEKEIIDYLQMFIVANFKEKYIQLGNEFHLKMGTFVSQSNNCTLEKMNYLRSQLRDELLKLKDSLNHDIVNTDKICSLIFTNGVDLEYDTVIR